MFDIVMIVVIMGALAMIDVPKLITDKRWKEVIVYFSIWVPAVTLGVLMVEDVPIPNPTVWIVKVTRAIVELF